jgi:PIN domain nuclease of toxin-antitoxin system
VTVLDTHALIWWADDNPKLTKKARQAAAARRRELVASAMSVFELITLERAVVST